MRVAVVGAGPAGVRAVEALVGAGVRPVWIDESPDGGGRIYQRPPAPLAANARALYGFEAKRATALHAALDAAKPRCDWRPDSLVWQIRPGARRLHLEHRGAQSVVDYDAAILCTGAIDRVIPVPGWTTPGVTSLGAAQIALKAQGCGIGARVVFVGTGPLLWLVAHQYAVAGAQVAAVLDTTPFGVKARAAPALLRDVPLFAKGLYYLAGARARRITVCEGAQRIAIEGDGRRVHRVSWHDAAGRARDVACDAVAIGWGLRPGAQLADLAGVPFRHDARQRDWVPERDAAGRTAVPGIDLAGDGAGIGGADAAERAGARAALALLEDAGHAVDVARIDALDRSLARLARTRRALEHAFPFPAALAAAIDDDTVLCRCEHLRAGELRALARGDAATGVARELNRAKSLSRVGMGRCQGRLCAVAAAEVLAAELGCEVETVGRLRGQPPVRPIPITAAAPVARHSSAA